MDETNVKDKIQKYEKELRKYNKFTKDSLYTFFELNQYESFKLFIDNQYKKGYTFDSLFGKEYQREDLDYVGDIFKFNFKTPINLRNKILKFMKQNNIKILPYETHELILHCDGKVYLNNELVKPFFAISYFRDLKLNRIRVKVIFMSPSEMDSFDFIHTNFKKYYFNKKTPRKFKKEEIEEYEELIDKSYKTKLNQKELDRFKELEQIENEVRFGKVKYLYKLKDKKSLIIERDWAISEIVKILDGIRFSLNSEIRYIITSNEKYKKGGDYKYQDKVNNLCRFFDNLEKFEKLKIGDKIREIRDNITNNKTTNIQEIDRVIANISNFASNLEDLFFLDMDKFLETKKYKF